MGKRLFFVKFLFYSSKSVMIDETTPIPIKCYYLVLYVYQKQRLLYFIT